MAEVWIQDVSRSDARKLISWWMAHDPKHIYFLGKYWRTRPWFDVMRVRIEEDNDG